MNTVYQITYLRESFSRMSEDELALLLQMFCLWVAVVALLVQMFLVIKEES